jgi:hypothetical protein
MKVVSTTTRESAIARRVVVETIVPVDQKSACFVDYLLTVSLLCASSTQYTKRRGRELPNLMYQTCSSRSSCLRNSWQSVAPRANTIERHTQISS